jgi:hypothetical protein
MRPQRSARPLPAAGPRDLLSFMPSVAPITLDAHHPQSSQLLPTSFLPSFPPARPRAQPVTSALHVLPVLRRVLVPLSLFRPPCCALLLFPLRTPIGLGWCGGGRRTQVHKYWLLWRPLRHRHLRDRQELVQRPRHLRGRHMHVRTPRARAADAVHQPTAFRPSPPRRWPWGPSSFMPSCAP